MPVQTPQWTDVLCCCICFNVFDGVKHQPISLVCGHTACRACLLKLKTKQCPFDQTSINIAVADLLQNCSILKILGVTPPNEDDKIRKLFQQQDAGCKFKEGSELLEVLAVYVKRVASEKGGSVWSPHLSRPMQRKLVTLLCCNLIEPEGRIRVMKAVRSLAERSLTELLLMHQNPYHLSSNLWATVRARGCQFLGPAMQEEVLKLVLLALSEGALISRKVLVMYIVQTLEKEYPQASKTSVGHVVQLLYRASCFNVIKRDGESSLMQLKEDFRTYDSLRREHDAQIVQIAMEAGLRISPDQWSALLYGDQTHKSHMQSIIDRLQTPQSFYQCIQELLIGLQRTGDPGHLVELRPHFELLADIDPSQGENTNPSWHKLVEALRSVKTVVDGQVKFCETYGNNRNQRENVERNVVAYKFKTSMCRDITDGKSCPRGDACTFAHCLEEMERYRARSRLMGYRSNNGRQSGDGLGDDGPASLFEGEEPPEAERKDLTQWNCQLNVVDVEQQQRKPYVMSPATFQQTLLTPTVVPPPTLAMPPPMKTVQQLIATDMSVAAPMLTATPPPQMNPQLAAVLAQPAQMLAQPPPANMAFPPNPFALNVMPQIPQYGTVRYQIIRPTNQPPTQVTSQLAAPISVTGTSDFGYYWYPPCGAGGFQSRVSGEVLHLEVPLARVIPGPSHLIHNLPNEYFTAPQQTFAPPPMEYYMYPPTGIPIRLDESGYVHTQQVHQPITVLSTGTLHSVNQTKPVIEDVTHICHDNKHCVEKASDEKKGRLVLLEKKRQEILIRLDALRINGQKLKRVENFNNNESYHSQRQQIVTSVMRDSSSSQSSIVASSLGNNGYSKGIYCSSQGDKSISNDSDCAFSNGSSAWSSVSSSPNSLVSKESLVPTSSVPLISKCCSKKVQRSLSSEVNGKGDQSNLYSPWNNTRSPYEVSKTAGNAWRQDDSDGVAPSDSKKSNNVAGTHSSSGYIYATRPYIPEDYIDIKHLSDDVLKKQLQQLPQTSKRLYYIRLELESRESYCWRSDDDLVIPFSGDPHVSRYGPISRSRVALTVNSVVATPSSSTTVASELVHVKDTIQQPLPTAVVQQAKDQYITSSTGDSTSIDVSSIPIVFQASAGSMGASTVGEKLDKVVEMKEKLENLPMSEGASSVEREQLKMDLEIINKEIATLDKETEVECLLKELKSVNLNIEALQQD